MPPAARAVRRIAAFALLGLVVLGALLAARAARQAPQPHGQKAAAIAGPIDRQAAATTLAAAIRVPTVSGDAPPSDAVFASFHTLLAERFPAVHRALELERPAGPASPPVPSLLYTWRGSRPDLDPLVLLAHQDVVPVADPEAWEHPPFAGDIDGDFVWGRGAIDDKGSLVAILSAVERLAASGRRPVRTVHLAIGHDEELRGAGAAAIAESLRARNVRPALVLDEGLLVTQGVAPGVARPVAFVGVAEKGYATVDLTVEMDGGHSSVPARESAIGVLARAVARLESEPPPARLDASTARMFEVLGREMSGAGRVVTANLWLLRPVLRRMVDRTPAGAAMLRTTVAPTIFAAGIKENVLAPRATATVNLRLLPGDSVAAAVERLGATIGDPRVLLETRPGALDPSPVSTTEGDGYAALDRAIRRAFPDAAVVPWLMVGATDARHYSAFTDRVYRFAPLRLGPEDLERFHGRDERVSIDGLADAILFYELLLDDLAF